LIEQLKSRGAWHIVYRILGTSREGYLRRHVGQQNWRFLSLALVAGAGPDDMGSLLQHLRGMAEEEQAAFFAVFRRMAEIEAEEVGTLGEYLAGDVKTVAGKLRGVRVKVARAMLARGGDPLQH
jgi:hypothetical protein